MLIKTSCSAVFGIKATTISVEVNVCPGLHYFMVGLPDNAVKESIQRVESAISSSGFKMPRQKIIINLAPADIRKEGSSYDLAIAIAVLGASHQIPSENLNKYLILGELSLDGKIQPVKGVLPIAIQAKIDNFVGIILPEENAEEAAIVAGIEVYGVKSLLDTIEFLKGMLQIKCTTVNISEKFEKLLSNYELDFADR